MAAVLVVAVAARLFGLGAAGQTWDEDVYWTAGRNLVQNLLELRLDAWWWRWNSEHPPVSKYLAGLGALLWDGFGPARGVAVVVSSLSCALLVPIGARLGARGAGLLAGLVAALTPHLIAHGQLVGHESPSLLWWTLGVLLALDVHRPGDAAVVPLRALVLRLAAVSVVVGLAVSTRFIGALLGPAAVIVIGAWAPAGQRRRAVAVALLVVPLGSLATFFALWPWLWDSPVARLQESWSVLRAAVGPEPYLGALTSYPPRSYFVRYLLATTPVGVLLAAALWALHAVATGWSRRPASAGTAAQQSWPAMVTVLAWLALPLVVCLSPVRKDGVRYVIPVVQGLSLVAGLGVAAVVARCSRRAALLAGAALVSYLLWSCGRAQPYYLDYYNELTGGAAQVSRDRAFETAWWGEGVDRAVAYVNQHAARGARVARSCVAPAHVGWFRGDLWTPMAQAPHEAEWIVAYAPRSYPCPVPADAQLVFAVTHRGLVLAEVYRRAAPR